jgi:hypothetical protein
VEAWRCAVRAISFSFTRRQLLSGAKTVTRRLGWRDLRVGERLRAVDRATGSGKPPRTLGTIEVTGVRQETLSAITKADVVAEGFPHWSPREFVEFFVQHMDCTPQAIVTRIAFRLIETPQLSLFGAPGGEA